MIICVVANPYEALPFVETLAQDYGGTKTIHASIGQMYAECEDGTIIVARQFQTLRGYKADEVWLPLELEHDVLEMFIVPVVSGRRDNIHYFAEKGFYGND